MNFEKGRTFEEYKEMIKDMSKDEMIKGLYDLSKRINEEDAENHEINRKLNLYRTKMLCLDSKINRAAAKLDSMFANENNEKILDDLLELDKILNNNSLKSIAKMIASGDIPNEVYDKYLSHCPIAFMSEEGLYKYLLFEIGV